MSNRGWQPAGTDNFRDLGGRTTVDGGRVRPGLVFRSDTLQEISPADADVLVDELGVGLIIDLRLRAESEREGHGVLADRRLQIVNLPLDVENRELTCRLTAGRGCAELPAAGAGSPAAADPAAPRRCVRPPV